MSWRTDRREFVLGYEGGKRETVVVPETEHAIEIGRLYGVDFVEEGWCHVHGPTCWHRGLPWTTGSP